MTGTSRPVRGKLEMPQSLDIQKEILVAEEGAATIRTKLLILLIHSRPRMYHCVPLIAVPFHM